MKHKLSGVVILPNIYDNYYFIFFKEILYVNYRVKFDFINEKHSNLTY